MFYLNLDENGYLLSVSKTKTSNSPFIKSLKGLDLSGDRINCYRWDGDTLVFDFSRQEEKENETRAIISLTEQTNNIEVIRQEIVDTLITSQINNLNVDNITALRWKNFYPSFESLAGKTVPKGFKFVYDEGLYMTTLALSIIPSDFSMGEGYIAVVDSYEIFPYSKGVILEQGKYYSQNEEIYFCFKSAYIPLPYDLYQLTGLFVNKVN